MEDWEFVASQFDDLGHRLENAKKHPFNVKMDFETRFRVWRDQILTDRLMQLRKHLSLETIIRFYNLTLRDIVRLYRRATFEFLEVADDIKTPQDKFKFFQELYLNRQNLLFNQHTGYVNEMQDIINGDKND